MLTKELIKQLAPDDASFKAGSGLKLPKWELLAQNEEALWGLCSGSGSKPYQVAVALDNFRSRCSCPSRKFPCKHAIGLMLHAVDNPTNFTQPEMPDWLKTWLDKGKEKAEKSASKAEKTPEELEKAQKQAEKTAKAREKSVENGVKQLRSWLEDLIAGGLSQVSSEQLSSQAKRMVDAKIAPVAEELNEIIQLSYYQRDNSQEEIFYRLSKLYLLTSAFQKIETLNPAEQAEIKKRLGFQVGKEEVLNQEGIKDQWLLINQKSERNNAFLTTNTYWFYGLNSNRFALYLEFITRENSVKIPCQVGKTYSAEFCFYEGLNNKRVLIRDLNTEAIEALPKEEKISFAETWHRAKKELAINPFQTETPLFFRAGKLAHKNIKGREELFLTDGKNVFPLHNFSANHSKRNSQLLQLLTLGIGEKIDLFAIYNENNQDIQLLAYICQGKFYQIEEEREMSWL